MIEINLIPDVKVEYLKARKQRRMVISGSILTSIVAGAVVVILAVYTFGVQAVQGTFADASIHNEFNELKEVPDLSKTLTIQNQMSVLSKQHDSKHISSRVFDIVSTAVPSGENNVTISRLTLDTKDSIVEIEGEAANGYEALEVFKKTLQQTKFTYSIDGDNEETNIATSIIDGERRYAENNDGERVLRFTLSFKYPEAVFSPTSQSGTIVAPNRQNATDSTKGVPSSLFSDDASTEDN